MVNQPSLSAHTPTFTLPFAPEVLELSVAPEVAEALWAIADLPHVVLFDSAAPSPTPNGLRLGRYSFLAADPWRWVTGGQGAPFPDQRLRKEWATYQTENLPGLPPFQGGLCGLLSYELLHSLEIVPSAAHNPFPLPAFAFGFYDTVVAWDHDAGRCWIISQGWPVREPEERRRRAQWRIQFFQERLASATSALQPEERPLGSPPDREISVPFAELDLRESPLPGLFSNFSPTQYHGAVQRVIDYIHAGDVFQVNLAQTLYAPCLPESRSIGLYLRLREQNPAPFGAYLDLGPARILSTSPERLVSLREGQVETRPIKGTRRRTGNPALDAVAESELLASQKDRAENVMIVDLMRNDLSRICTDPSIRVTQLCGLEPYGSVIHLVSAIEGTLRKGLDAWDLLAAVFPGGSITGAPKIRAMEIIAELEPTARNAYCGSLGYLGFGGNADFNILIRTITEQSGWLQIPVGGGIVARSQPALEYEETWTKAAGMLRALEIPQP